MDQRFREIENSSGGRPLNYGDLLYREAHRIRAERERLAEEAKLLRAQKEMEGATFHPVITPRPHISGTPRRDGAVFDRLYSLGRAHATYIEQLTEQRLAEEREHSPFKPTLSKTPKRIDLVCTS